MFTFYQCPENENRLEKELLNKSKVQWLKWNELKNKAIEVMDERYSAAYLCFGAKMSEHGKQCVGVLNALLPEDVICSLNEYEILLILISCYIHDIGLVTRDAPYRPISHAKHFELGADFILHEEWLSLSMIEKEALSYIIRNHNVIISNSRYKDETPTEVTFNGKIINLKLLIGMIQLADFYHHVIDVVWTKSRELSEYSARD